MLTLQGLVIACLGGVQKCEHRVGTRHIWLALILQAYQLDLDSR